MGMLPLAGIWTSFKLNFQRIPKAVGLSLCYLASTSNKRAHNKYLTFKSYFSFDVYHHFWEETFRQCFILGSQVIEPEAKRTDWYLSENPLPIPREQEWQQGQRRGGEGRNHQASRHTLHLKGHFSERPFGGRTLEVVHYVRERGRRLLLLRFHFSLVKSLHLRLALTPPPWQLCLPERSKHP